jgi:hypothetical protein
MPELKRTFLKSRMNKDYSNRLIPGNEYRDALDIQISSSEGSNVGSVEQLLGNSVKKNKSYDSNTGLFTEWAENTATENYLGLSKETAVTIGSYRYNKTKCLYGLITSDTVDCILEYNKETDLVRPIIVDTQGILGFSADNLITGINILGDNLFFAYEGSEPKQIPLTAFREATVDFVTHTSYLGRDFTEADITVIKKSPLTAPTMVPSRSDRVGITESTVFYNFALAQTGSGSISEPYPNEYVVTLNLDNATAFIIGDKLKLTANAPDTDDLLDEYTININVTSTNFAGSVITGKIVNASNLIEDKAVNWKVVLFDQTYLFELKFPRFAYRWKYNNNQFSTISPFTNVAFIPDDFLYNSQKGYNVGMTNHTKIITLSGFETPPVDVKEIEVLYKESNSNNIYTVDTVELDATEFVISNELIYKTVASSQLLRPWDNVPRWAKAQESVGNRIIYANYLQNYTVKNNIEFSTIDTVATNIPSVRDPYPSVKSLRTYQAGVVFKDTYGRETPVFSHSSGVIKTLLENSTTQNKLAVQLKGDAPIFATHFKLFIKEISNEYYNLAADRLYLSEDNLSTWISFPSSERNKVSIDSYLIAKKNHDVNTPVTDNDNKYKILDIQNEAPLEIANSKQEIFSAFWYFDKNFGSNVPQITKLDGSTPTKGYKTFLLVTDTPDISNAGITEPARAALITGNYIRFEAGDVSKSKYYKISNVIYDSAGVYEAKVFLAEAFGSDIDFLYTDPSVDGSTLTKDTPNMTIHSSIPITDQIQFLGRFFVKLNKNNILEEVFSQEEEYEVANAALMNYNGYVSDVVNVQIIGGGYSPKRDYTYQLQSAGLDSSDGPSWATNLADVKFDIVFESRNSSNRTDKDFLNSLLTPGTKIRFSNHDTIYKMLSYRPWAINHKDKSYIRYYMILDKPLEAIVHPKTLGENITVEILAAKDGGAFTSTNPAIFETEPKEAIDLDLYYEVSGAFPIAEYNDYKEIDWFNCYAFGNGVESNRIRDDYNAITIDRGPKVSTVLDEPYSEELESSGLIFSGLFNSDSGVNNLNQFLIAESITKRLNPEYGTIQKLHTRDTDLVVLCEDKCLRIMADKDALYNADGSTNVTASNNVLGQAIPFVGEYGISKNPESFASYGFRAYFSDMNRGVQLRLSRDGLTEISSKGLTKYISDKLKASTAVLGTYDDDSDCYNLTLDNSTLSFMEAVDGWPTRKSFIPEAGLTLSNIYYTFKNGMVWSHDNENRNDFYEQGTTKSSITLVFNDAPSKIKNFKNIYYEGSEGWQATSIETDQQSGTVLSFVEKEGIWYNYIKGLATSWDNTLQSGSLDTKEFSVQGIDTLSSATGDTTTSQFNINIYDDPSDNI